MIEYNVNFLRIKIEGSNSLELQIMKKDITGSFL